MKLETIKDFVNELKEKINNEYNRIFPPWAENHYGQDSDYYWQGYMDGLEFVEEVIDKILANTDMEVEK